MTNTLVLSGKDVSEAVYKNLEVRISSLQTKNVTPGLAVILVGEDPASQVYVRSKTKTFNRLLLYTKTFRLSSDISGKELLKHINKLNIIIIFQVLISKIVIII